MTIYYINPTIKNVGSLLDSLVEMYGLERANVVAVVVKGTNPALDPLLSDLAEHVVRQEPEAVQKAALPAENKTRKYTQKLATCPECGKMAAMTKKGYCKPCAMRKAKAERKNGHTVITDRNPDAFIAKNGAIKAHRLG